MNRSSSFVPVLPVSAARSYGARSFLALVAIFLAAFGSKLWLIRRFGNDVPFWDQWNGEGSLLYKPLLEEGIGAVHWFAAHNEHRIFLQRVTATVLLYLNGQWDPLVQMCWGAFCVGLVATTLCAIASRLLRRDRPVALIWVLVLLGTAMPFGWENALAGFQTSFYYLVLAAALMFHVASRARLSFAHCAVLAGLGVVAIFTMASGCLVSLSACAGLLLRMASDRGRGSRWQIAATIVLLIIGFAGWWMTPVIVQHAPLRAHDPGTALRAFRAVIGWPTHLGVVVWIPMALLALRAARRRAVGSRAEVFVFSFSVFVLLNAAAIATMRATSVDGHPLDSRYTDIAWLSWFVNLWAAVLLADRRRDHRFALTSRTLLLVYFIGAAGALLYAGRNGYPSAVARGDVYALEAKNTRDYVSTGDPVSIVGKPLLQIPFPDANTLRADLDDPTLRDILPPGIRPGLLRREAEGRAGVKGDGFVRDGVPLTTPPAPGGLDFFGSYGASGGQGLARLVGSVVRAQGRYVRLEVAGHLGRPDLSIYLEDPSTGRRSEIAPRGHGGDPWSVVIVKVPGPTYRVVAEDRSTAADGWFAFTDPVELGALRPQADRLIAHGAELCLFGLLLLVAALAVLPGGHARHGQDV